VNWLFEYWFWAVASRSFSLSQKFPTKNSHRKKRNRKNTTLGNREYNYLLPCLLLRSTVEFLFELFETNSCYKNTQDYSRESKCDPCPVLNLVTQIVHLCVHTCVHSCIPWSCRSSCYCVIVKHKLFISGYCPVLVLTTVLGRPRHDDIFKKEV
jgi:hypothetical protein